MNEGLCRALRTHPPSILLPLLMLVVVLSAPGCTRMTNADLPRQSTPGGDDDVFGDDDQQGDDDSPWIDETPSPTPGIDLDGDGYFQDVDCDDDNPAINPGAAEVCDQIDNNCDGDIDQEIIASAYLDMDGDGFGDPGAPVTDCESNLSSVGIPGDCDDGDPMVHAAVVLPGTSGGDGTWETPFGSGQAAIDAEGNCDTIFVQPGQLDESLTIEGRGGFLLLGLNGADVTAVASRGGERALVINQSDNVRVKGIAFQATEPVEGSGGAILVNESSSISLVNLRVVESLCAGDVSIGGGIAIISSEAVTLENTLIEQNEAERGGGLAVASSTVEALNLTMKSNYARDGGGGVYIANTTGLLDSVLQLSDSTVEDNEGRYYGGGAWSTEAQTFEVYNTLFFQNRTYTLGAGAVSITQCKQCSFIENDAYGSAVGYGGGLYLRSGAEISNSLFLGNSATAGGAITILKFAERDTVSSMTQNTFVDNNARFGFGETLYVVDTDALYFRNNLVFDSGLTQALFNIYVLDGGLDDFRIDYNNLYVSSGQAFDSLLEMDVAVGQDGNTAVLPAFKSYTPGDFETDDLHLSSNSECIDAGNPELGYDVDGSLPDQGAYGGPDGDW